MSTNKKAQLSTRDIVPGFGPLVRQTRETLGWTIEELAKRTGISWGTVASIERETRAPSLRVAIAVMDAMQCRGWLDRLPEQKE